METPAIPLPFVRGYFVRVPLLWDHRTMNYCYIDYIERLVHFMASIDISLTPRCCRQLGSRLGCSTPSAERFLKNLKFQFRPLPVKNPLLLPCFSTQVTTMARASRKCFISRNRMSEPSSAPCNTNLKRFAFCVSPNTLTSLW